MTAVVLLTLPSPVRPALPYVLAGVAVVAGCAVLVVRSAARRGRSRLYRGAGGAQRAASVQIAADTRLAFLSWADGAPASRTVTVSTSNTTLTANYQSYYLLSATADPAGEASWQFSPASPDGFYSSTERQVSVVGDRRGQLQLCQLAGRRQRLFC